MFIELMVGKIHRAVVTDANLEYMGSITIDKDLMDAAGILPHQKLHVVNNNNGQRFVTYAMEGKPGSGVICLNGAAARLAQRGDIVIIMTFGSMPREEAEAFKPKVVFVDKTNSIINI